MCDKTLSKEELIKKINMLEIENDNLKQELNFYKENDKVYHTLFNSIDQGLCIIDVIFDDNGKAIDILYEEANPSYESMVQVSNLKGKRVSEALVNPEKEWLELWEQVALYGESVRFTKWSKVLDRCYDTFILRIGGKDSRRIAAVVNDITERVKTEEALQKSEEMLSTITENSSDGINMFDLKTCKYVYMNQSQINLFSYTENDINYFSEEEVLMLVHPDDRHIIVEMQKSIDSGTVKYFEYEYRRKLKSGEYRWFSDKRTLLKDEQGTPNYIITISRDITEQKKYEEKLAFKAKVLSNVNDAIIAVDENDRIKYCNKAFVKLFGWQEYELIGQQFVDFGQGCVDEVSKEKILWSLEERLKAYSTSDENHLNEIICYSKDGNRLIVDINITVGRDSKGEFKRSIYSIRDVSERYKYELELKKSEEKYRYLFNSIDEGFVIFDVIFDKENKPVDYRLIEFNQAYEKQTGFLKKNVLGKTAKELKFDSDYFWYETFGKVALTGESERFVNKSKTLNMWFDVYVFKINLEEGNKVGVLFKDVTEEVLHNHKLEELIKMQDDLYVNVSHELKTPLNVIFSANQVMDMYLKSDSIEDKKDKLFNYNNSIKQNCYRLTKLINNIVDLSKSNSGLLKLNLCNVNIVDVVENIVRSVSEYVESKELKIIFDTNVEEKIIACDTDKIERVMLNLISNAIKFSNPNGEIFVNVLSKAETVEIKVKDTGIGIEKQNLVHMFKKFYQEDKSLSRNAEGSGIGLSLIKSLVELHGGNISVESEVNKGSIFKVELPARTIESHELIEKINTYSNKVENIKIEFSDIYSI